MPDGVLVTAWLVARSIRVSASRALLMFGSDIWHNLGDDLTLAYSLYAVNGLKSAHLIEKGIDVQRSDFTDNASESPLRFTVSPLAYTWYSQVVIDANSRHAYNNPIWISVTE